MPNSSTSTAAASSSSVVIRIGEIAAAQPVSGITEVKSQFQGFGATHAQPGAIVESKPAA